MPKTREVILAKVAIEGQHEVVLVQKGSTPSRLRYEVQYGDNITFWSGKDGDIDAAHEFGECVLHAANCAGLTTI
jgi:hypothetical protein